mgnify:CR=1 FL=1
MPKMDGITFCGKVKKTEQTSHIPIILLTAKTSEESQVEGLKFGADIYVSKPFNMDVLKAQVESLLHNRALLKSHLSKTLYVSDLAKGASEQDNSFVLKIIDTIKENIENSIENDLSEKKLKQIKLQTKAKLENALKTDEWKKSYNGRDILNKFTDSLNIEYYTLRNSIINLMVEDNFEPNGMKVIIEKIIKPIDNQDK